MSFGGHSRGVVYVLDDDAGFRASVAAVAESMNLECRAFSSVEEFQAAGKPSRPGCLILDHMLGGGKSGLAFLNELNNQTDMLATVICTAYANVPLAVEYLRAGVVSLVEKPFDTAQLAELINEALSLDKQRASQYDDFMMARESYDNLSDRQKAVLWMILDGRTNKSVARAFDVSERTIEVDRARILEVFCVENAVELARVVAEFTILARLFGSIYELKRPGESTSENSA